MRSVSNTKRVLALLGLALAPASWGVATATAAETVAPAQQTPATHARDAAGPAVRPAVDRVDGLGPRVDAVTLGSLSGGTELSQQMTLTGTVSNNQTDHAVTGNNVISTGSFDGATGLPMVIQNTGNGVLIQNATIISVKLQP